MMLSDHSRARTLSRFQLLNDRMGAFSGDYPYIQSWFANKVVPGFEMGTRKIFWGERGSFLLAKNEPHERKICTLWVEPTVRGRGVASDLMAQSIKWLGTKYPLMSLPDHRKSEFASLLKRHDFRLTQDLKRYYTEESTELVYNGWIVN